MNILDLRDRTSFTVADYDTEMFKKRPNSEYISHVLLSREGMDSLRDSILRVRPGWQFFDENWIDVDFHPVITSELSGKALNRFVRDAIRAEHYRADVVNMDEDDDLYVDGEFNVQEMADAVVSALKTIGVVK